MGGFISPSVGPVVAVLLCVLSVMCAITDLWKGKIYNVVTYPATVIGLVIQVWLHGLSGLGAGLGGFAIGFFPAFMLFILGGMGGGDVKLLGAVGALAGGVAATETLIIAYLVGALFALGKLAWHGVLFRSLLRSGRVLISFVVPGMKRIPLVDEGQPRLSVRFGVAIALATLATLWDLQSGVLWGWVRG